MCLLSLVMQLHLQAVRSDFSSVPIMFQNINVYLSAMDGGCLLFFIHTLL